MHICLSNVLKLGKHFPLIISRHQSELYDHPHHSLEMALKTQVKGQNLVQPEAVEEKEA